MRDGLKIKTPPFLKDGVITNINLLGYSIIMSDKHSGWLNDNFIIIAETVFWVAEMWMLIFNGLTAFSCG